MTTNKPSSTRSFIKKALFAVAAVALLASCSKKASLGDEPYFTEEFSKEKNATVLTLHMPDRAHLCSMAPAGKPIRLTDIPANKTQDNTIIDNSTPDQTLQATIVEARAISPDNILLTVTKNKDGGYILNVIENDGHGNSRVGFLSVSESNGMITRINQIRTIEKNLPDAECLQIIKLPSGDGETLRNLPDGSVDSQSQRTEGDKTKYEFTETKPNGLTISDMGTTIDRLAFKERRVALTNFYKRIVRIVNERALFPKARTNLLNIDIKGDSAQVEFGKKNQGLPTKRWLLDMLCQ